jgi:hypothetical protein
MSAATTDPLEGADRLRALEPVEERPAPRVNLPASFYVERPELAHIRQAAHAAGLSADAVLGAVLAHVAILTPPWIKLPAPVATPGTLDVLVAIIGPSGAGKTSCARIADQLLPITGDDIAVVPLGSGEGMIEAYLDFVTEEDEDGKKHKVKRQVNRAVLAMLDEGQALSAMAGRQGSQLLENLRSAWAGALLGQHNASAERRRHVAAGEYRFALIAGFQTMYAADLIGDVDGGTPQRFSFVSAIEPELPEQLPDPPGPLPWRPAAHQAMELDLDHTIATEIQQRHYAVTRGDLTLDPLDSHRNLSRLKIAGLLAILAGRYNITTDDWRLAGATLDASDRVRATVLATAAFAAQEAERRSTARLVRRTAELERTETERALDGMAKAIARHVHRSTCAEPCGRSCVTRSTAGKHRRLVTVDEALTEAHRHGWIVTDADTIKPGETCP